MEYVSRSFSKLIVKDMDITLIAVGRMNPCPEANLVKKYVRRFDVLGPLIGVKPIKIIEIDEKKFRTPSLQAGKIREKLEGKASVFLFDEHGAKLSSKEFMGFLSKQIDSGIRKQTFIIGGAFGLCPSLKKEAAGMISLGSMVWPHFLARVLVTEQMYRAASLMTGNPYHKD